MTVLQVSGGGTLTTNAALLGNGTSPIQTVAAGNVGHVLADNGTSWYSRAGDYVNVVDYGADPTGHTASDTAFANAIASGNPVFVPAGTYTINTGALTGATINLIGAGGQTGKTTINLGSGVYFIDDNQEWIGFLLQGLYFNGGAGIVRNRYTGANVTDLKVVEDCAFINYTACATSDNCLDGPYWKITRCIFNGANYTTCMGIALSGLTDGCAITHNPDLGHFRRLSGRAGR